MNNVTQNKSTGSMYAQNGVTRQNLFNEETGEISSEVVQALNMVLTKIIDERIEQRLVQEDIAKVYTAKVASANIGKITLPKVTSSTTEDETTYSKTNDHYIGVQSITVVFEDFERDRDYKITLSGSLVKALPVTNISVDSSSGAVSGDTVKYVKICTYDGINFHLLHDI